MLHKIFASLNIAIVGKSALTNEFAARFALLDHQVFLAENPETPQNLCHRLSCFDNVWATSIGEAAELADVVILAAPPSEIREVSYWLGDVRKKVVIDASGHFADNSDVQVKTVQAIKAITGAAHIVKIFLTRGYESFLQPLFAENKVESLLAGDSKKAKELAKFVLRDFGLVNFYDFGDSNSLNLFDELIGCFKRLGSKNSHGSLIASFY